MPQSVAFVTQTLALLYFIFTLTFAATATAPGTSIHETLFGDLGYDSAIPYLDVVWPPLKSLHINDRKAARSIFVVNIRSDVPAEPAIAGAAGDDATPWLSREQAVLKICPPPASECEVEAWAHYKVSRVTRCPAGAERCTCSPHFVPIYESWNALPLPLETFNMPLPEAKKRAEYQAMGMGSPSVLYMLLEKASPYPVRDPEGLPGYSSLSTTEQQRFGEYVLFQLSFALYVLKKLDCSHSDLAKVAKQNSITANMLYDAINGADPCAPAPSPPGGACPWGHCWTAEGRTWCFDRASTPLMDFIVKIFDFGTANCKPSPEETSWRNRGRVSLRGKAVLAEAWEPSKSTKDDLVLPLVCRRLRVLGCPKFPPAGTALFTPFFARYSVESIPDGACVFGPNVGGDEPPARTRVATPKVTALSPPLPSPTPPTSATPTQYEMPSSTPPEPPLSTPEPPLSTPEPGLEPDFQETPGNDSDVDAFSSLAEDLSQASDVIESRPVPVAEETPDIILAETGAGIYAAAEPQALPVPSAFFDETAVLLTIVSLIGFALVIGLAIRGGAFLAWRNAHVAEPASPDLPRASWPASQLGRLRLHPVRARTLQPPRQPPRAPIGPGPGKRTLAGNQAPNLKL